MEDVGTLGNTDPLIGTVLGDRYRIDEVIGEGGHGKVYLAHHLTMQKRMAVKVIHPRLTDVAEALARFEVEAVAVANIDHPNAVTAIDFGRTSDRVYLVMEHVGGDSLESVLGTSERLPPRRVVHIARQILRALRRAHSLGIIHRDIKPENVKLVERDGDLDFVKVLDFGIAKLMPLTKAAHRLTKRGMTFGTPMYMSPEQARGHHVDARSDLYSIGVLMYRMLTGRVPFDAEHPVDLLFQHMNQPPPTFSMVAPEAGIPVALEALVMRLLAKAPDERFPSAGAVLTALDDISLPEVEPLEGAVIGGYEIRRRIGEGGMCQVYEAFRKADGRRVALKVCRSEWAKDEQIAKRFMREAMVASSLTNPNTIELLDFGRSDQGVLYIAMELLEGETLAARLRRLSRLPPVEVAQIAVQICVSLSEAHAKGVVHRDLKPENVMLSAGPDGTTRVTVLDYGLAAVRRSKEVCDSSQSVLTQVGTILGTPSYMSPEQARGDKTDERSDLYSLGVILYEMLAGRAPFRGDTILRLLDQQRNEAPPLLDGDVPLSLAMLVWQMLDKRPERRPKSATAIRAGLLEWLRTNAEYAAAGFPDEPVDVEPEPEDDLTSSTSADEQTAVQVPATAVQTLPAPLQVLQSAPSVRQSAPSVRRSVPSVREWVQPIPQTAVHVARGSAQPPPASVGSLDVDDDLPTTIDGREGGVGEIASEIAPVPRMPGSASEMPTPSASPRPEPAPQRSWVLLGAVVLAVAAVVAALVARFV